MKTQDDVQRAHDTLIGIILGESPIKVHAQHKKLLSAQADVLCWFLGCEHNDAFRRNLDSIEMSIRKSGVVLIKTVAE